MSGMSREKYDLFVSYSRADVKEVIHLVNLLKSRIPELVYWFDITGIESASEFEDKIISAINNSEYVLFAVSENSLKSDWSKDEVTYAKNIGKKVIPVLLKGASMQEDWFLFKFGRVDCIDSTDSMQLEKLISDLSRWVEKPVESESVTSKMSFFDRIKKFVEIRKKLVISVLASLLLILSSALLFGTKEEELEIEAPVQEQPLQEQPVEEQLHQEGMITDTELTDIITGSTSVTNHLLSIKIPISVTDSGFAGRTFSTSSVLTKLPTT